MKHDGRRSCAWSGRGGRCCRKRGTPGDILYIVCVPWDASWRAVDGREMLIQGRALNAAGRDEATTPNYDDPTWLATKSTPVFVPHTTLDHPKSTNYYCRTNAVGSGLTGRNEYKLLIVALLDYFVKSSHTQVRSDLIMRNVIMEQSRTSKQR